MGVGINDSTSCSMVELLECCLAGSTVEYKESAVVWSALKPCIVVDCLAVVHT